MSGFRIEWVVFAIVLLVLPLAAAGDETEQIPCTDCHETDAAAFAGSVHGGFECADCHVGADEVPHPSPPPPVDCAACHEDVVEQYQESVHGRDRVLGLSDAPNCVACHGDIHVLVPVQDPGSPVNRHRLPETCGTCHADPEVVEKYGIPVARPIEAFRQSVHARQVAQDNGGPSCSNCHESHAIFPASDPRSTVFHQRVPDTCAVCHEEIATAYAMSVHGRAASHGAREAPVCTDCHGEHRILSPREAGSPVFATNVPKMTCGRCHGDLRLAEKYGIAHDKVPAYEDSYHGLASRAGVVTVAHCGSCHGVHDILPSSDPASHTHADNLSRTCGQCHAGAGTRFAISEVHLLPTDQGHVAVYTVRLLYLWLIGLTVAGMLLHNGLDLYRKFRTPPVRAAGPPAAAEERMCRGFRIAHALLIVSFVVLVYTGFALKYPETWWARPLLQWEASFGLRGWLHRVAAVAMLGALAVHVVHLALDRRARICISGMRPRLSDLHEFRERVGHLLGRRPEPPAAPSLGYAEKIEYLALMWGLIVMAVTGFLLWFENPVLRHLPKWVSDVATVIHFYEAILASLAIVVWHLYFVIFDPVVYPMDTAWLTGRSAPGREAERRPQDPGRPEAPRSGESTGELEGRFRTPSAKPGDPG